MQNNSYEFTPTESNAGGTLLYIAHHLSYKPQTDLSLNKASQLETTIIEIIEMDVFINILIWTFLTLKKIILTPFLINCP